jgi:copper chaperone
MTDRIQLGLTDVSASAMPAAPASAVNEELLVTGMTCAHCVASVTEELRAIDGVTSVDVDLVPGGTSVVRVVSRSPLAEPAVAEAVAEAGYELAVP